MKFELSVMFAFAVSCAAKNYTVLTFGDSWGDYGPTWKVIRDTFAKNGVPVTVKSAAVGGTTACAWALYGNSMVAAAKLQFPELKETGPDFVWFTAGGNDMVYDKKFHKCTKQATSINGSEQCTDAATAKVRRCTEKLFDHYWKAFPKSQIMQANYDVPCESNACRGMDDAFLGEYCGSTPSPINCYNTVARHWVSDYIGTLAKKYKEPQYTAVHIEGVGQMVEGDVKAHVGVPDLDRSGVCRDMLACVHPAYGSKYATAVGDAFWRLFFNKYTKKADVIV